MVKCEECKREMKMITVQHLEKCCGLTLDEYKKKHPGCLIISEELKNYRIQNCKNLTGRTKIVFCDNCGRGVETPVVNNWPVKCEECKTPTTYQGLNYLQGEDKVVCQICWQAFEQITITHLGIHGMTMEEYREKFPGAPITNQLIIDMRRNRHTGDRNPTKQEDVKKKMKGIHTYRLKDYQRKYPFFCKIENPRENDEGEVEVQCKNCKKWFVAPYPKIFERIRSLEKPEGSGGQYLYCSDECKEVCPLYRLNPTRELNSRIKDDSISDQEYGVWKKEVMRRQKEELGYNECEYCGNRNVCDLCVHHEKPRLTHQHLALDPDNGIILCGATSKNKCHYKIGHRDECSTGRLSHLICEE